MPSTKPDWMPRPQVRFGRECPLTRHGPVDFSLRSTPLDLAEPERHASRRCGTDFVMGGAHSNGGFECHVPPVQGDEPKGCSRCDKGVSLLHIGRRQFARVTSLGMQSAVSNGSKSTREGEWDFPGHRPSGPIDSGMVRGRRTFPLQGIAARHFSPHAVPVGLRSGDPPMSTGAICHMAMRGMIRPDYGSPSPPPPGAGAGPERSDSGAIALHRPRAGRFGPAKL
jgi:hypothetical protein